MNFSRPTWRKSSHSTSNGACVEIAGGPALRLARDSKNPVGPVLAFTAAEWSLFIRAVKTGTYDPT